MKKIVNEFECTVDVMEAAVKAALKHKARNAYFLCAIAAVGIVLNLTTSGGSMENLRPSLLLAGLVVLVLFLQSRANSTARSTAEGICDEEGYVSRVELGNTLGIYHDGEGDEYSWNGYKNFVKTDEFILVFFKKNGMIPLKMDSFIEGTPQECIELLKKRKPKGLL